MTVEQFQILAILLATVAMFLWSKWRHDMVALGSLLVCAVVGLVPAQQAFAGFGHPAVVTVACVLVLSRGMQTSGAVDAITRTVLPARGGVVLSMTALVGLGAVLSSFMNNVGAMALLMPVAIKLAGRLDLAPGQVLMPLAFGTILGGMTTLIGTPPNLIVSAFRAQTGSGDFTMFDFTPVGLAVAMGGVAFIALVGWRLVPIRQRIGVESFETGAYITEAQVPEGSRVVGMRLREIEALLEATDVQIIGMVQSDVRMTAPDGWRKVRAGDILIVEAEAEALSEMLFVLGLTLEAARKPQVKPEATAEAESAVVELPVEASAQISSVGADSPEPQNKTEDKVTHAGDVVLMELAVLPGSSLAGRSASDILLRTRYGLNLLALSRQGQRSMKRLRSVSLLSGDLLLLQGPPAVIAAFAADNGCVPLAERELRIPDRRKAWEASIIMALAVASAAIGILPVAISFAIGVLASMLLRTVPPRSVYDAVDWPVIVLLGALIPVAGALESTGSAALIGRLLLEYVAQGHAVVGLTAILVLTMTLSDVMNNAATAAVMCPIAIGTAAALGVSADSFLMAVAIGASCAFLTPIGHQNNTLILGPGGFRFGDYWQLGLPLEIGVVMISIPLLLIVWPL